MYCCRLSRSFSRPGGRRSTPAMPESQESTQQLSPKVRPGIPISDQLDPLSFFTVAHEVSSLGLRRFSKDVDRDASQLAESVDECADETQEGNIVWTDTGSQSLADQRLVEGSGEVQPLLSEESGQQFPSAAVFQPVQAIDSGDREGFAKNSVITQSIELQGRPTGKVIPADPSPEAIELDQSPGSFVAPDTQCDVVPADRTTFSFIPPASLSDAFPLESKNLPESNWNKLNLHEEKSHFASEKGSKIYTPEPSQSVSLRRLEGSSLFSANEPDVHQTLSLVSKPSSVKKFPGLSDPSRPRSKTRAQASPSNGPAASRRRNKTKEPNLSEESFGVDSIPIKYPEPLDVIANLLRQHSEEMEGEAKRLEEDKMGPAGKFELSGKQGDKLFDRHEKIQVEMSGEKDFEAPDLAARVSSDRGRTSPVGCDSSPGSPFTSQKTNVTFHSSPHTLLQNQYEPSANIQRPINHINDRKDGVASQSCHLLRTSPPVQCHGERFRSFAEQGCLFDENRLSIYEGDLFSSSQVVEGGLEVSEDAFSQRSNIFQATQMVRQPSGPSLEADMSSSRAITSPRSLAPTQRSSSVSPENSQTLRATVTDSIAPHSPPISASVPTSKPLLSSYPSIPPHRSLAYNSPRFATRVSTEDNGRFDIPQHRQLQRTAVNHIQLNDHVMESHASEIPISPEDLCGESVPAHSDADTARPIQSSNTGHYSPEKPRRSQEVEEVNGRELSATVEPVVQATGDDQPTIDKVTHNLCSSQISHHSSNDLPQSEPDQHGDPSNPFLLTHEIAPRPDEKRVRKKRKIFSPATRSMDRPGVTSKKNLFKGEELAEESNSSSAPEDADDFSYRPVKTARALRAGGRASIPITSAFSEAKQTSAPSTSPLSTFSDSHKSSTSDDENDVTTRPVKRQKSHNEEAKGAKTRIAAVTQTNSNLPSKKKVRHVTGKSRVANPHVGEDFNRVLASYGHYYYPARIVEPSGLGYRVIYDDNERRECGPDKLRKLILKRGDELEAYERHDLPTKMEVLLDWDGNERGVKCVSNGRILGYVELRFIRIRQQIIKQQFSDRLFASQSAAKSPTWSTLRSPVKNVTPQVFEGMIVLVLTGVEENSVEYEVKNLSKLIEIRGGMVAKDWAQIFEPDLHLGHFKRNLSRTPFVIPTGTRPLMTSTFMVALAKGIPVLSVKYVNAAIEEGKVCVQRQLTKEWHD